MFVCDRPTQGELIALRFFCSVFASHGGAYRTYTASVAPPTTATATAAAGAGAAGAIADVPAIATASVASGAAAAAAGVGVAAETEPVSDDVLIHRACSLRYGFLSHSGCWAFSRPSVPLSVALTSLPLFVH